MSQKAFSIGNLKALALGGGVPNGQYQLKCEIVMHKGEKSAFAARPGLRVTFQPVKGGEAIPWFYGFGSDMEKMWAPNAAGTGIVPLAGVTNPEPPKQSSNYGFFLKHLYNAQMPENFYDDDCSVLNGAIVFVTNVPEPEERKGFQQKRGAASGEGGAAAPAQDDRPRTIAVVSEFAEGGKPWEGPVAPITAAAPAKAGKKTASAAAPAAQSGEEVDPEVALMEALGEVLSSKGDGCSKVAMNTEVFAWLTNNYNGEIAAEIQAQILNVPDELKACVEKVGFTIKGFKVVKK